MGIYLPLSHLFCPKILKRSCIIILHICGIRSYYILLEKEMEEQKLQAILAKWRS